MWLSQTLDLARTDIDLAFGSTLLVDATFGRGIQARGWRPDQLRGHGRAPSGPRRPGQSGTGWGDPSPAAVGPGVRPVLLGGWRTTSSTSGRYGHSTRAAKPSREDPPGCGGNAELPARASPPDASRFSSS